MPFPRWLGLRLCVPIWQAKKAGGVEANAEGLIYTQPKGQYTILAWIGIAERLRNIQVAFFSSSRGDGRRASLGTRGPKLTMPYLPTWEQPAQEAVVVLVGYPMRRAFVDGDKRRAEAGSSKLSQQLGVIIDARRWTAMR